MRSVTACLALLSIAASPVPAARLRSVDAHELARALAPRGRPLVVHYWASWCRPCLAELPAVARALVRLSGNGVDVLLVSLDEPDRAAEAEHAVAGLPIREGTLLLSPFGEAEPVLRERDPGWDGALPTTLLLDEGGHVAVAQRGFTRLEALERAASVARSHPSQREERGSKR